MPASIVSDAVNKLSIVQRIKVSITRALLAALRNPTSSAFPREIT